MAQRAELARPVMRRRTRFQPDHTAGNAAEERQHLPAPQSLTHNRRTLRINAVNLKNMLGYVQADCRNLAHGWLPFRVILRNTSLARRCRKGAIHPIIRSERPQMLDNPRKTETLMAALKAAVPFEVELTPEVVKQLRARSLAHADQTHRIVLDLSYAGDEGGIACHIVPVDKKEALFISIT